MVWRSQDAPKVWEFFWPKTDKRLVALFAPNKVDRDRVDCSDYEEDVLQARRKIRKPKGTPTPNEDCPHQGYLYSNCGATAA